MADLKALSNQIELDVAMGNLSAAQTFTKMRDLLNLALSHAAGQEVNAERYRYLCARHPLRMQRWLIGTVAEGGVDRKDLVDAAVDDQMQRDGYPAVARSEAAPPTTSAEVGRDDSLASIIPCRCFDEVARRLCLDRGICSRTYALAAPSGRQGDDGKKR